MSSLFCSLGFGTLLDLLFNGFSCKFCPFLVLQFHDGLDEVLAFREPSERRDFEFVEHEAKSHLDVDSPLFFDLLNSVFEDDFTREM